jgi:hypothetical protein
MILSVDLLLLKFPRLSHIIRAIGPTHLSLPDFIT